MAKRKQPPRPPAAELAVSDYRRGAFARNQGPFIAPNVDEILSRRGGLRAFRDIAERDDVCRSVLALRRSAVVGPGWILEPFDSSARAKEEAELLRADLDALPGSFASLLGEMVWTASWAGHSLAEMTWNLDGAVRLVKLATINPEGISFKLDAHGNLVAIVQEVGKPQEMAPEKFFRLVNNTEHGSPYGRSEITHVWRLVWFKTNFMQWMARHTEALAMPPVVAKVPRMETNERVGLVLNTLSRLQADTSLAVPEGWEVSLLTDGRPVRSVWLDLIDGIDLRIARGLLCPALGPYSGGEVKGGSFALGASQAKWLELHLAQLREALTVAVQEQLIRRMVQYRWGIGQPEPKFRLLPLDDGDKLAILSQFNALVQSGTITPREEDEAHARRLLGFPVEQEETSGVEELREKYGGAISLKERIGGGVSRRGSHTPSSSVPTGKGGGGDSRQRSSARACPPSSSSSLFAESEKPQTWRPLNRFEERSGVLTMAEEERDAAREFATTLALGAEELVSDLKAQVEKTDFRANPARINALKPSPAVLAWMRARIEKSLLNGFERGRLQGLRAIERSTNDEESGDGALRGIERSASAQVALVKTFAELDPEVLTPTMRARYARLRGRLVARGYMRE